MNVLAGNTGTGPLRLLKDKSLQDPSNDITEPQIKILKTIVRTSEKSWGEGKFLIVKTKKDRRKKTNKIMNTHKKAS